MVRQPGTYYDRNREASLAKTRAYYRSHPEVVMWHNAKHRAKRKGIFFDISVKDIVIPEMCPVFGTPMVSPSIDRFDNSIGYTKENIRIISNRANTLKNDASIEEIEAVLRYMKGT